MFNFKINLYQLSKYRSEIYGVSILWIMLFHGILCKVTYPGYINVILKYGNMGCEIFLFLSGICLYFSFYQNTDIVYFTKRRLKRIAPPLITICGTYWGFLFFSHEISLSDFISRIFTIRFWLVGDQQIWFISFILLCYILYPYFYFFIFEKGKKIILRTAFLIAFSVIFCFILREEYSEIYNNIEIAITRFPVFLIGCLFGKFVFEKKAISAKWTIIFLVCILFCFSILERNILHGIYRRYFYLLGGIPITIILPCIFEIIGTKLLCIFRFLGNLSLELYLSHIILIRLYKNGEIISYTEKNIYKYLYIQLLSIIIALISSKIVNYLKKIYMQKHDILKSV